MMFAPLIQAPLAKDAPYAWFLFDRAKQNFRYYLPDFKGQAETVEIYLDAFNYTLEHTYHGLYIENQRKDAYKTTATLAVTNATDKASLYKNYSVLV